MPPPFGAEVPVPHCRGCPPPPGPGVRPPPRSWCPPGPKGRKAPAEAVCRAHIPALGLACCERPWLAALAPWQRGRGGHRPRDGEAPAELQAPRLDSAALVQGGGEPCPSRVAREPGGGGAAHFRVPPLSCNRPLDRGPLPREACLLPPQLPLCPRSPVTSLPPLPPPDRRFSCRRAHPCASLLMAGLCVQLLPMRGLGTSCALRPGGPLGGPGRSLQEGAVLGSLGRQAVPPPARVCRPDGRGWAWQCPLLISGLRGQEGAWQAPAEDPPPSSPQAPALAAASEHRRLWRLLPAALAAPERTSGVLSAESACRKWWPGRGSWLRLWPPRPGRGCPGGPPAVLLPTGCPRPGIPWWPLVLPPPQRSLVWGALLHGPPEQRPHLPHLSPHHPTFRSALPQQDLHLPPCCGWKIHVAQKENICSAVEFAGIWAVNWNSLLGAGRRRTVGPFSGSAQPSGEQCPQSLALLGCPQRPPPCSRPTAVGSLTAACPHWGGVWKERGHPPVLDHGLELPRRADRREERRGFGWSKPWAESPSPCVQRLVRLSGGRRQAQLLAGPRQVFCFLLCSGWQTEPLPLCQARGWGGGLQLTPHSPLLSEESCITCAAPEAAWKQIQPRPGTGSPRAGWTTGPG